MPIEKKEFYTVKCDRCDDFLDTYGYGGFSVYHDLPEAKSALGESGDWHEHEGEILCDECWNELEKCEKCNDTKGPFYHNDDGWQLCSDCLFENQCDEMGCGPNPATP